jgi:hypothetical protein
MLRTGGTRFSTLHSAYKLFRLPCLHVVQFRFLAQGPIIRHNNQTLLTLLDASPDPVVGFLGIAGKDDFNAAATQFARGPTNDSAIKDHRHIPAVVAPPNAQTLYETLLIVFVLQTDIFQDA